MLLRLPRLFRIRGGRFYFRSRAVLQKNPGNFGEMVSPKPAIFREFLGFWVGAFPQKFRELLGFWSLCVFEISRKFQRRGEMMYEEETGWTKRKNVSGNDGVKFDWRAKGEVAQNPADVTGGTLPKRNACRHCNFSKFPGNSGTWAKIPGIFGVLERDDIFLGVLERDNNFK